MEIKTLPNFTPFFSFENHFLYLNEHFLFEEEYFFKLLASLRKSRLNIPENFTLEFIRQKNIEALGKNKFAIARITWIICSVENQSFDFQINVYPFSERFFSADFLPAPVGFYPDAFWFPNLFTEFHVHRAELHAANIFAIENDFSDVFLQNHYKRIARTLYGDVLLKMEKEIFYIPKHEGASNQVLTQKVLEFLKKNHVVEEAEISPFETQKAEAILIVSENRGLKSVSKIRNKIFTSDFFQQALKGFVESFLVAQ